jgi:hypothetical protein
VAVETVFSVWMAGFLLVTWPDPPWGVFQLTTIVLMGLVPFIFFPFSKTLFLAFDLLVRPPEPHEFDAPHEPSRSHPRNSSRNPA